MAWKTLNELNIRANYGINVVALKEEKKLMYHQWQKTQ